MKKLWFVCSALVAIALVVEPTLARADQNQAAAAQTLFEEGRELVKKGRFTEACPKLAESLRLDRGVGTMLWLADCYEKEGKTASAWSVFTDAAAEALKQNDGRERVARRRATEIEPKVAKLAILFPEGDPIEGLEVRRDKIVVNVAQHALAMPLDPGWYSISASAPGHVAWSSMFEVRSEQTASIRVPRLARAVAAPVAVSKASPMPVASPADSASTTRLIGLSLAALGVASAATGAYLGVRAGETYDESNADGRCVANRCDDDGKAFRDDAGDLATASTIAFAAAGAAIIGGAVLWFTSPKAARTGITVAPRVGVDSGGLSVGRAF